MTIFQDQIWTKSCCEEFESSTREKLFSPAFRAGAKLCLVDACQGDPDSLFVTDNVVRHNHVALYPEYWGGYYYNSEYISRPPDRIFNCLIHRVCVNRQSWFYQLVRKDLLNHGYVSYLLDYRIWPEQCKTKQDLNQWLYDQGNQVFENEHKQMQTLVPYANFEKDIDQVIVDSKVSLVLETYFHNNDVIAFSEKVFRTLQLPRPFLLYSAPGAVKNLRLFGFDLFDDIVDHGYDSIQDHIQRQTLILDQLDKFRSIVYTQAQLEDFELRANHNRELLKKFKSNWPNKLEQTKQYLLSRANNNK